MPTPRAPLPIANLELVRRADEKLVDAEKLLETMLGDAPMSTDARIARSARALANLAQARMLLREAADLKRVDGKRGE